MRTLIDICDSWARTLATLSWQVGVLILVVAAFTLLLRRGRPAIRHALWCVVLVRLCIVGAITSPVAVSLVAAPNLRANVPAFSVPPVATGDTDTHELVSSTPAGVPEMSIADSRETPLPAARTTGSRFPQVTLWAWLGLVWFLGALWLSAIIVSRSIRLYRIAQKSVQAERPELIALLEELRERMGVRRAVRLKALPQHLRGIGPCATGLIHPVILLPPQMVTGWQPSTLESILLHELAHIRRWDVLVQFVQLLTQVIYWFHPLVWFAHARLRHERELICDDIAIAYSGRTSRDYGVSLVQALEECRLTASWHLMSVGIGESRLMTRLRRLLDSKYRAPKPLGIATIALIATCGVMGILVASSAESKSEAVSKSDENMERTVIEKGTVQVRVVDPAGKPVEGAIITPEWLYFEGGSLLWQAERHGAVNPVRTDREGLANVVYPKFASEEISTSSIGFFVDHPQFCRLTRFAYSISGESEPVTLKPGGTLELSGYVENKEMLVPGLRVHIATERWEDSLELQSWKEISPGVLHCQQIPEGTVWLRLVQLADSGATRFSDLVELKIQAGKGQKLNLPLKVGVRLEGSLDESVPRPVENGWITMDITARESAKPSDEQVVNRDRLVWGTGARIQPDGSFVLPALPSGNAELIAGCNGYVSIGSGQPSESQRTPQSFVLEGALTKVSVKMEQSGVAEVQVLDEAKKPVEGVVVVFSPNARWSGGGSGLFIWHDFDTGQALKTGKWRPAFSRTTVPNYSAVTNAAGLARVPNLPSGEQSYFVDHKDFKMLGAKVGFSQGGSLHVKPGEVATATVSVQKKTAAKLTPVMPRRVIRRVGEEQDPHALPVEPGENPGELSGRVMDQQGNPIAGVLVDAWHWHAGNETRTAADGSFVLKNLSRNSRVEVRFIKEGYAPYTVARQPVGKLTAPLSLDQTTFYEGVVTGPDGKPVPDASIRANQGPKQADGVQISDIWTETRSDSEGRYRLLLQEDTYDIQVTAAPDMVARLQKQTIRYGTGNQLNIALTPGVTFRARVVDSQTGKGVPNVTLNHWQHPGIEGVTDAEGKVEMKGLLPGSFEFDVKAQGYCRWWSEECSRTYARRTIEPSGWQRNFDSLPFELEVGMSPVTITLEKSVRIRGKVIAPDGTPVAGATVDPARTGSGNSLTGDTRFSVRTKEDGSFELFIPASNKAEYNLVAHDGKYGERRTWANGVAEPIHTTPGQEIDAAVIQLTRPGTVRGRVIDEAGRPIADREVRAHAVDKLGNRYYDPTVRTNSEGQFELKFVRPAKHYIQAAPFWLQAEKAPNGSSLEVEVTEGQVLEIADLVSQANR